MKIETQPRDDQQIQVIAEFDEDTIEKYMRRAGRKMSQKSKIPGFRPGKAPYDMIVRFFGQGAIEQEAMELMIDDVYPEVIKEANIKPSGPGNLEEISSIHPPKFTFIIPLEPEVVLGDYASIRREYNPNSISEEDVDNRLQSLRRAYATAEPVERAAVEGDLVYGMISGELTGELAEGEERKFIEESPYQTVIGDKNLGNDSWPYPGFSLEFIGLEANQEKVIDYVFPDNDNFGKQAGKAARFVIKIQSIKALILPELNDEFAKTMGEQDTLEDLRKSVRDQMENEHRNEYDQGYFTAIINEMIAQSTVKYPPHLLDKEVEHSLEHLKEDLTRQKLDLPTYLKWRKMEEDAFIEAEVKPASRDRLVRSLVLEKFSETEKIELTPEELQSAFTDAFSEIQNTSDFGKIKGRKQMENLANYVTYQTANRLLNERIMDRIKTIAAGQVVPVNNTEPVSEQVDTNISLETSEDVVDS